MSRPVVHFELWSKNPEGVSDFYREVFDWEIQPIPELNYHMVAPGEGGIGGGIMKPDEGELPGNMAFYLDVDDLDAYGERVKAAGGTLIVEKQEVPGMGHLTLFADPDGRVLGMWQRAPGSD